MGGIGPSLEIAHLAESLGMSCEVHGTGAGNLAVCAAISNTSFQGRGLLHPFLDYDRPPEHLRRIDDEMDEDGFVRLRDEPGPGQDLDLAGTEAPTVADGLGKPLTARGTPSAARPPGRSR